MKRRTHIAAPYKTFNGSTLNAVQCQGYNDIQDDINRWIDAGRDAPEWLLDWSHRYFVTCCDVSYLANKIEPIMAKLAHAGRFALNPSYSVFAVSSKGEYTLLTSGRNTRHIAETLYTAATSGDVKGLECRCDGIRCDWN